MVSNGGDAIFAKSQPSKNRTSMEAEDIAANNWFLEMVEPNVPMAIVLAPKQNSPK